MPDTGPNWGSDLLRIDDQLGDDERLLRDTLQKFTADRVLPHIACT
jgi:glutaryl-CoA dehydrogenase